MTHLQNVMSKLLPFWIINFVHELYLFQILSTVQQTRINWALWRKQHHDNLLIPKIQNRMRYCLTFTTRSSSIQSVCVSIWGLVHIYIDENQTLVHIVVFGMVTSYSDIMPPSIFSHDLRLNMEAYIKCLEKVVLSWIKMVFARKPYIWRGYPHGVMVKAMNCGIVVSEFVLQSCYYIHFQTNTLGKGMNPLILPAMG